MNLCFWLAIDGVQVSDYTKEYRRLTRPLFEEGGGYMGGQADLTPLKNKAREAVEALNDAQKAADSGRSEDAMEGLRRARAAIDIALGGQVGPGGSATPPAGMSSNGSGGGAGRF